MQPRAADLDRLSEWIAAGAVAPVVDREFAFADAPDAMRHAGAGHARGKTVIVMP
jgi:NADPH:quinone reductase-like Zn-dependent oxidoreductase